MNLSITKTMDHLETLIEKLPDTKPDKQEPCEHTIMCMCERRHCPGRTLDSKYYARKLGEA